MNELDAVKEIVKANAVAIYQDSTQPSLRVLGKMLAQYVSLFATPTGRMAEIFEKNIIRYIDKLAGLSDVQIIPPETRILVPVLERLRYTDDDVVADYYAQILATASTVEHAKKVSVAFIEILNRLCADEIRILEFINSRENSLLITTEAGATYHTSFYGVLPVMNVHITEENGGYNVAIKNLSYLLGQVELNSPNNFNMYLDNMFALGLLLKPAGIRAHDDNIYNLLKKSPLIKGVESKLTSGQNISYSESRIETTELGKQLLLVASKHEN